MKSTPHSAHWAVTLMSSKSRNRSRVAHPWNSPADADNHNVAVFLPHVLCHCLLQSQSLTADRETHITNADLAEKCTHGAITSNSGRSARRSTSVALDKALSATPALFESLRKPCLRRHLVTHIRFASMQTPNVCKSSSPCRADNCATVANRVVRYAV